MVMAQVVGSIYVDFHRSTPVKSIDSQAGLQEVRSGIVVGNSWENNEDGLSAGSFQVSGTKQTFMPDIVEEGLGHRWIEMRGKRSVFILSYRKSFQFSVFNGVNASKIELYSTARN